MLVVCLEVTEGLHHVFSNMQKFSRLLFPVLKNSPITILREGLYEIEILVLFWFSIS
jgi:hypothetical protein